MARNENPYPVNESRMGAIILFKTSNDCAEQFADELVDEWREDWGCIAGGPRRRQLYQKYVDEEEIKVGQEPESELSPYKN